MLSFSLVDYYNLAWAGLTEGNQLKPPDPEKIYGDFVFLMPPQTRTLVSWMGFPTLFFLKLVMIAWLSVLIE